MEDGVVTLVRSRQVVTYPARFMVVAAMNPCPCGYRGSEVRTCTCGYRQAQRYLNRISGPLLDRFDLFVRMAPVHTQELISQVTAAESSSVIAKRIFRARQRQRIRFKGSTTRCNAAMSSSQLRRHVPLDDSSAKLLSKYANHHGLSARALHRSCKVARTLADLEGSDPVTEQHLLLALNLQQARWKQ
jgi:magnesium chelatase family protein